MDGERQPWERQTDDTPKSWAAFCLYRDLGSERSLDKAYRVYQKPQTDPKQVPGRWKIWSRKYNWVSRVAVYDEHIDALARAKFEKEKLKAREERHQLIRLAKSKLLTMLNNLDVADIKANEVVNFMRLVLQEERAEYDDEPAQRHEHSGPGGKAIDVNVIDEALRKIYGEQDQKGDGNDTATDADRVHNALV